MKHSLVSCFTLLAYGSLVHRQAKEEDQWAWDDTSSSDSADLEDTATYLVVGYTWDDFVITPQFGVTFRANQGDDFAIHILLRRLISGVNT